MEWLVIFGVAVVCAIGAGVAGRYPDAWAWGLFFGPFGIVVAALNRARMDVLAKLSGPQFAAAPVAARATAGRESSTDTPTQGLRHFTCKLCGAPEWTRDMGATLATCSNCGKSTAIE